MIPAGYAPAASVVRGEADLMASAIAGVLRNAQEGELPLFAWTLGLPQPELLGLIGHCFPELGVLEPLPAQQYAAILHTAPTAFYGLAALILAHRTPGSDVQHATWLAHTLAAASFGSSHLWEELGLAGREEVSAILARYFEPLARSNTENLKWKRFLFLELGRSQGVQDMHPPHCRGCDQMQLCCPTPK